MSDKKQLIGFRVHAPSTGIHGNGIRKLTIEVREFVRRDAMKELEHAIKFRQPSDVERWQKIASKIAAENEDRGTEYLIGHYGDCTVEVQWQDDNTNGYGNWYAPDVSFKMSNTTGELYAFIVKAIRKLVDGIRFDNVGPRQFVKALTGAGCQPVRYISDSFGDWVVNTKFDLDAAIPLPEKKEESQTEPEATTSV